MNNHGQQQRRPANNEQSQHRSDQRDHNSRDARPEHQVHKRGRDERDHSPSRDIHASRGPPGDSYRPLQKVEPVQVPMRRSDSYQAEGPGWYMSDSRGGGADMSGSRGRGADMSDPNGGSRRQGEQDSRSTPLLRLHSNPSLRAPPPPPPRRSAHPAGWCLSVTGVVREHMIDLQMHCLTLFICVGVGVYD